MLMQQTVSQLKTLKLDGMARAFEEQVTLSANSSLSFDERFGMIVDRELAWRDTRRLERLLKTAKLKNAQACVEDIDYRQSRGLDQRLVATLAGGDWIRHAQNLILTGPTGAGKTWIACAFGQQACRQGFSVLYVRVGRLFEELKIAHGDGGLAAGSLNWPRWTSYCWTIGVCKTSTKVHATTCLRCSMIALARAQPSSPVSYRWSTGTLGFKTRPLPMPFWIALCTRRTSSH